MSSVLARRLASAYSGAAPLALGALASLATTIAAWPLLARNAVYPDVVVGEVTWDNVDKVRDFRALYLFFALTALFAFLISRARRARDRNVRTGTSLAAFLILATLPAVWWFAVSLTAPAGAKYLMPWTRIDAAIALALDVGVLLFVFASRRRIWTEERSARGVAFVFLAASIGLFDALAIATFITRVFPSASMPLLGLGYAFAFLGATAGAMAAIVALKRGVLTRRLLFGLQIPLPLLFFVVVSAPILNRERLVSGESAPALIGFVSAVVCLAWYRLWARHRRVPDDDIAESLSPLCISAIALFVALPSLGLPELVMSPDHLHFGERALPFQQWISWGKTPYVDFIPIHGLMGILRGFFNRFFFDNTAPGIESASLLLAAIFAVLLFLTVQPLVGVFLALVVAAFSLSPMMFDRWFFFTPTLFGLAHPQLITKPKWWLFAWLVCMPFVVLYNAPIGTALVFGTIPVALWMAARTYRSSVRDFISLLVIVIAAIAVVALLPGARSVAAGLIQYVRENQAVNNVANGIAFEQNFHLPSSLPDFVAQTVWGISRISWIPVVVLVIHLAWREMAYPRAEYRISLILLAAMLIPTLLIVAQWALGRIDLPGGSRTDTLSYISLFQILPVVLALAWPMKSGSRTSRASLALGLVIAISLTDFLQLSRVVTGQSVLKPRSVPGGRLLVRGAAIGLPNVGTVVSNSTLGEARALKTALASILQNGETYANLGLASDFYYYLDLPVPTLYAEAIVPASGEMQGRMLGQIAREKVSVALAAPWEVTSLRDYYFYRYVLSHFTADRIGAFVFLIDSARAPAAGQIGSDSQIALLDSIYRVSDLKKIPSAWGGSWQSLAQRFDSVFFLDTRRQVSANPSFEYSLTDTSISGRDADFVRLKFAGPKETRLLVSWAADGRGYGAQTAMTVDGKSNTLLIPLGANPSWLLRRHIDSLKFEVSGTGPSNISLSDVLLLRLRPPR